METPDLLPSPDRDADVSVAMATYNGARFLGKQLDSILTQSILPAELVINDDQSTDATVEIIRSYAATAPFPIQLAINRSRLGYRRNFLRAAGRCTQPLVFFCDQDDAWLPTKIERMVRVFDDPAVMLAYHNATLVDAEGSPFARLYDGPEQRRILDQAPMPPWHFSLGFTQAFRRALTEHDDLWALGTDHLFDEPLAHDQWYFFLASSLGRVSFVDEDLVSYRQHGANLFGAGGLDSSRRRMHLTYCPATEQRYIRAAHARALILDRINDRATNTSRLSGLSRGFERMATWRARRLEVYEGASVLARFTALLRSVRNGDYIGSGPWSLRPRSLLRDTACGVFRYSGDPRDPASR